MKVVLFCERPYSFAILEPLQRELTKAGDEVLWYVASKIVSIFPNKEDVRFTSSMQEVYDFKSDIIFVPGNIVPHYLRGLKVQVFHGLAGEKKGHFRIRNYFDLYLTQGPYFTSKFEDLAKQHKDFSVVETGWSKLDQLYTMRNDYAKEKDLLLTKYKTKKIVLYAPTFSPSLTSAEILHDQILTLISNPDILVLVKFHDLMNPDIKKKYIESAKGINSLVILDDPNILKYMLVSDLLISDTSSVVYEFLLLDKPVITLNSASKNIKWTNVNDPEVILSAVNDVLLLDIGLEGRKWIIQNYHPFSDGKSSYRMIKASKDYLLSNSVPEKRKLSMLRRFKVNKTFGKVNLRN